MERHKLSDQQAFALLVQASQHRNIKLRDIASSSSAAAPSVGRAPVVVLVVVGSTPVTHPDDLRRSVLSHSSAPSRPEPQAVTAVHGDLWQRDATASGLTSTWRRADGRTYWAGSTAQGRRRAGRS